MISVGKYFPELFTEPVQKSRLEALKELYENWNAQINVISRKDLDNFYERHVLHSLSILNQVRFKPGARVLDIGTGGGFPGIPLAIAFPDTEFVLADSIGKKIKVVEAVSRELELKNVQAVHARVESLKGKFDFIVSRAVAQLDMLIDWTAPLLSGQNKHEISNSWLLLKGGDLEDEIQRFIEKHPRYHYELSALSNWFEEDFFETKKLLRVWPRSLDIS